MVFQSAVYKKLSIVLVVMLCGFFIFPAEVLCEFYKYVDKDGKIFYVDDLSKVPSEYQDQIQTYKEKYDHLPADQQATARQKDQEIEQESELEHNVESRKNCKGSANRMQPKNYARRKKPENRFWKPRWSSRAIVSWCRLPS